MSKAILILDKMPKRCILCDLATVTLDSNLDRYIKCTALERKICDSWLDVSRDNNIHPEWCPLRPLPERRENGKEMVTFTIGSPITKKLADTLVDFGFNVCLDEMTREEEEER